MKTKNAVARFSLLATLFALGGCGESTPRQSEWIIDNNGRASFSLNTDNLELSVGETFSLFPPTYLSEEGLSWVSSDPSIVFVDGEGLLKARDLGEALVYAYDSKAIASVSVVVTAASLAYSLELSSYSLIIGKGEDYSCRVTPSLLQNGEKMKGIEVDVEKKEESSEGVATCKKEGEAYRFIGISYGTAVYSFSVLVENRRIGKNLSIQVIEMN